MSDVLKSLTGDDIQEEFLQELSDFPQEAFLQQSLKSLHIYEFNNIKINLNSNFKIKHLFEKISEDFFLNELLQFQFFITLSFCSKNV